MPVGGVINEWFTVKELAAMGLPGLPGTKRGLQMVVAREGWDRRTCSARGALWRKRAGRGGGVEYHVSLLPEAARARLTIHAKAPDRLDRIAAWQKFDRLPERLKDEARRRLAVVEKVEALTATGHGKSAAIALVIQEASRLGRAVEGETPFCARVVHKWFERVAGVDPGDRAAYLAPDYAGRTVTADCSPEAWDLFKDNYLRQSNLSAAESYKQMMRRAPEEGWVVPSLKTLQRRLDAEIPPPQQIYLRQGDEALKHTFPHMDRDRSSLVPMQMLNLDGHTFDVLVEWPCGHKSRPYCLAVQDIASGKILAVRWDMSLNHHQVRLALGDAFRQFGLADTVLMDNGTENTAAAISGGFKRMRFTGTPAEEPLGLLGSLGVRPLFASPRSGQVKPIERAFRNFAHIIAKHAAFDGAYTGHDTVHRPENHRSRAVPFAEFEAIVRTELAFYNAQPGRRGIGMNGRSFDQAFAEGMAGRIPRVVTPEQLRMCMLASRPVTMDRQSGAVRIEGHRYWSQDLGAVKRQKVTVRFDPERMDLPASIYAADGRFLCEAGRVAAGNFDCVSDARAQNAARRDYTRGQKLQAKALRRMFPQDVAAQLQQAALPEPPVIEHGNVVRPAFQAPRNPAAFAPSEDMTDAEISQLHLASITRIAAGRE